jgi:hypothetical protein
LPFSRTLATGSIGDIDEIVAAIVEFGFRQ